MTEPFSAEVLKKYLENSTDILPACHVFECLDSTNSEAKRMCADGFSGRALLVAARQSAGRGRMGRHFYSPASTGAYFSILYTPQGSLADAVQITSAASVAVMRAIRTLTGHQCLIKWVNDLYFDDKKVCGILTESVSNEHGRQIIVGIGINLSTEMFPEEIADVAGALHVSDLSVLRLVAAVYKELERYLANSADTSWLADYRAYSCVIGKQVIWETGERIQSGEACGIDESGALLVRTADGHEERLATGEISLRVQPPQNKNKN